MSKNEQKAREWIKVQGFRRFPARAIRSDVFQYKISRSTVGRILRKLADEGLITKSTYMKGRSSQWIIN